MKKIITTILILVLCLVLVNGLSCQRNTARVLISACQQTCQEAINNGQDLSLGPCLLDPMPQDINWVCDVAHNPRLSVDNNIENQCNSFNNGEAKHFIEVTPECKFITAH